MNRKYLTAWVAGILLGFCGGGIGGYILASGRNPQPEIYREDVSPRDQMVDMKPPEDQQDEKSKDSKFDSIVFPYVPFDDGCNIAEFISWFGCRSVELSPESGGLHIAIGHPLVHDPDLSNIQFAYSGRNLTPSQILDAFSKETGISYSIRPCAVLWKQQKPKDAERGSAEQPATRSEADSEGNENPQPESEGRSQ